LRIWAPESRKTEL
jgi:hypothetical protein